MNRGRLALYVLCACIFAADVACAVGAFAVGDWRGVAALAALWAEAGALMLCVAAKRARADHADFLRAVVKWTEVVKDGAGKPAITQEFFGTREERIASEPKTWNRRQRRRALALTRQADRRAARKAARDA